MLTLHPKEIYLEGPYNAEQWTRFALINNLPKNQAFKIKSTKPDRIGISPHCGFIRALDRVEVLVSLAGNTVDPAVRQREKFLIQSAVTQVPSSVWDSTDAKEVLRNVQSNQLGEAKLLMRFLPTMTTSSSNLAQACGGGSSPTLPQQSHLLSAGSSQRPDSSIRGNDYSNEFHNGLGDKNATKIDEDDDSPLPNSEDEEPEETVVAGLQRTETKKRQQDVTSAIKELKDRVNALEAAKALPKTVEDEKQDKLTVPVSSDRRPGPELPVLPLTSLAVLAAGVSGVVVGLAVAKKV